MSWVSMFNPALRGYDDSNPQGRSELPRTPARPGSHSSEIPSALEVVGLVLRCNPLRCQQFELLRLASLKVAACASGA
jgi:hypothetical protein